MNVVVLTWAPFFVTAAPNVLTRPDDNKSDAKLSSELKELTTDCRTVLFRALPKAPAPIGVFAALAVVTAGHHLRLEGGVDGGHSAGLNRTPHRR